MHNSTALAAALVGLRTQAAPFIELMHRSVRLTHFNHLTAAQALFASTGGVDGTRFVLPLSPVRSLYVSRDVDTACREGNQTFYQALAAPGGAAMARAGQLRPTELVVLGIFARTTAVLDLRDPAVQAALGTTPAELRSNWRGVANAPTQLLGEAVFQDGHYEGLIYESARLAGHNCVVLFPDLLKAGSQVNFQSLTAGLPSAVLP